MNKTIIVTEEFDDKGNLVKRTTTTTETGDTYTPYAPRVPWDGQWICDTGKTYVTG